MGHVSLWGEATNPTGVAQDSFYVANGSRWSHLSADLRRHLFESARLPNFTTQDADYRAADLLK